MKGIGCRNVQKYVSNHNREVNRTVEGLPSVNLKIQNILGINGQDIKGHNIFTLSNQEILYYSSQHFIAYNLISKESVIIKRQGCFSHEVIHIGRFRTNNKTTLILTIQKHNNCLYVGQLQIVGCITETTLNGSCCSQSQGSNYSWKVSRMTHKHQYGIEDVSYHPGKEYLYLLTSLQSSQRMQKYLWVYDIKRECMIMSPFIKTGLNKSIVDRVWVTEESSEVYLFSHNYFRMWSISFNEKTLKESNYRNIQRALRDKTIIKMFDIHPPGPKMLCILTETMMLLLKKNELVSSQFPAQKSMKQIKNKDNIQAELQKSLNQIYRMKFMFDEDENVKYQEEERFPSQTEEEQGDMFSCASDVWVGEQGESIVVATKNGTLMTYSLTAGQMKLISELTMKKRYSFDHITVSRKGQVIVLSQSRGQQLYIINKYILNSEDREEELKLFWGMGHIKKQDVVSISSPAVHERMCTLGANNMFKLWGFKGKQRSIIFEQKMSDKVTQLACHPCGLLVALNFTNQIKLMSVLPTGLYEVMSAKTNYNCKGLQYSTCGNFLVSNQQNLLIFYNPFTLKTLGHIEPPQLKSRILDFQITAQGSHIVYHTSDFHLYLQALQLYGYNNKYEMVMPVHRQTEAYTCFHFDQNIYNSISTKQGQPQNIFIGCTTNKYMVLYKNYGKELMVEYPIQDCYIQAISIANGWLFAATSKNTIRVYKWPIRQHECELEVINFDHKAVKLKQPKFQEYSFWNEARNITQMHQLAFSNKLVITRTGGIVTVLKYDKLHPDKFQEMGERKKLTHQLNDTYFITKNESDKRNRLIEKTEGDILKIQSEIAKEKVILERKYSEECAHHEKNFQQKLDIQIHEKNQYLRKMDEQNIILRGQLSQKSRAFELKQVNTEQLYANKQKYQDGRNHGIQNSIEQIESTHKKNLLEKVEQHKKDICGVKKKYRDKVWAMKDQFQHMVTHQYPSLNSQQHTEQQHRAIGGSGVDKKEASVSLEFALKDGDIMDLTDKVDSINKYNGSLETQLSELKGRVRTAEYDDEEMQKEFQKRLQQYNSNRFTNLSLHSQVLKMRTQLLQRKQIMQNKQEIINTAYQQKQKLQNYKQLVKGSLSKLHQKKQSIYNGCINKENQVSLIFSQLSTILNQYEKMKADASRLVDMNAVYEKDRKSEEERIKKAVNRLKELKRYLLLQGLSQDQEQKERYVEQENLLTNINFYKKRLTMETMKDKKNKSLKKSALNLVLKQNKNLLEEVNHLRQQTFGYEHEMTNLGKKLGEANRMISIECKLRGQKTVVNQQRNQLQAIRALFNSQIAVYNQEEEFNNFDIE